MWALICTIAIFFFSYSINKTKTRSKLYLSQVGTLHILAESMHTRMNPVFRSSTTFQHFTHTLARPSQALYSSGRPWTASFKSSCHEHHAHLIHCSPACLLLSILLLNFLPVVQCIKKIKILNFHFF